MYLEKGVALHWELKVAQLEGHILSLVIIPA